MAEPQSFKKKWRVQWLDEQGKRRSAVLRSHSAATRKLRQEQARVDEVRQGLRRPRSDETFAAAALTWINNAMSRKRSWRDDETRLRLHAIPFFGARTLDSIDDAAIADFVRHLREKVSKGANHSKARPLAFQTIRNVVAVATKILRDAGYPVRASKLKRLHGDVDRAFDYIRTAAEVGRVIAACEPAWFRVFVPTAVYSGMRRGELLGLRWADFDFLNGWITVERSFDGPTKSGKGRRVPIASELEPILKRCRLVTPGELVFPASAAGGLFSRQVPLRNHLRSACRRAGVGVVRIHDLRHTFASHFMMNGGDLYRLQAFLGHSTPVLTQRYAHLAPGHLVAMDRSRLSFQPPAGGVIPLHTPCTQPGEEDASAALSV